MITNDIWKRGKLGNDEVKPLLRGMIHFLGFYIFLILGLFSLFRSQSEIFKLCFSIYLLSMLLLFGTSTFFHTTRWNSISIESMVQKLDHSSIFLLITGTYTPVCLLQFDLAQKWPLHVLISSWLIGISGIIKSIVVKNPPKFINVLFYFACGLSILPFLPKVFGAIGVMSTLLMVLGGVMYLIGGIIYGIEWPDPSPKIYGYHEIFHSLTLFANICFLIPIITKPNPIYP